MSAFNFEEELELLSAPNMLKKGFKFYVERRNIKIKNKTDFNKKYDEFLNLKIGG